MNKMKRVFSLVLAFAIVLGTFGSVVPAFAETVDAPVATEELNVVPEDVIGTEYEAAVRRLVAFGLIEGYPDGSYKPEREINRAQMAKLLVYALGLDDAVRAAEGQSTGFKDVKGDYWAAGYINVASGQGLIQGYPDGSYRPAEKVTYAHTLTMLVRALGYQDEFLSGNWPGNYVAKAADVGITRGLRLPAASTEGSKRGIVAQLINNTLDSKVVKVDRYVGIAGIEYEESKETLLKNKLEISKHEDTRITADKLVDDGLREDEATIKFLEETRENAEVRVPRNENEVKTFDTKFDVRTLIGEEVTTYLTDRDVVLYVERENDDRANFDFINEVNVDKKEISLVKFDRDYKISKDAVINVFDVKAKEYKQRDTVEEIKDAAGKMGKFVVRNNEIVYAEIMDPAEAPNWLVVLENDNGQITGVNGETEDFKIDLRDKQDYDYTKVYNTKGEKISLKDLERGNVLYIQEQDYDGDDVAVAVAVQDNKIEGELGRVKTDRIEIGGKETKVVKYKDAAGKTQYPVSYAVDSIDEVKSWDLSGDWEDDMEDAYKEDVEAYTDATGKIVFLTTEGGDSGYKFGIVTRTYADGDRIRIYTTIDGKEGKDIIFKADKESDIGTTTARMLNDKGMETNNQISGQALLGSAVKFRLDNDGEIAKDKFFVMPFGALLSMTDDFGKDIVKTNKGTYAVTSDSTVVIDAATAPEETLVEDSQYDIKGDLETKSTEPNKVDVDDFNISSWKNIKEDNKNEDVKFFIFPKTNKAFEVDGFVFVGKEGANTGSDEEAVYITDRWKEGDDLVVEYVMYPENKIEKRVVDTDDRLTTDASKIKKEKAYVGKAKSNGKIAIIEEAEDFEIYRGIVIDKVDGNYITKTTGKWESDNNNKDGDKYESDNFLLSGSLVYDEDKSKTTSFLKSGMKVDVISDGIRARVVGYIESDATSSDSAAVKTDGVVTYIDVAAGKVAIEVTDNKGNFKVYDQDKGQIRTAVANFLTQNSTETFEGAGMTFAFDNNGNITSVKSIKLAKNVTGSIDLPFDGMTLDANGKGTDGIVIKGKNVTVMNVEDAGNITIEAGADNPTITDVNGDKLTVEGGGSATVRVKGSKFENVELKSSKAVRVVMTDSKVTVKVTVTNKDAKLELDDKSAVKEVVANEAIAITGANNIETVTANEEGVKLDKAPGKVAGSKDVTIGSDKVTEDDRKETAATKAVEAYEKAVKALEAAVNGTKGEWTDAKAAVTETKVTIGDLTNENKLDLDETKNKAKIAELTKRIEAANKVKTAAEESIEANKLDIVDMTFAKASKGWAVDVYVSKQNEEDGITIAENVESISIELKDNDGKTLTTRTATDEVFKVAKGRSTTTTFGHDDEVYWTDLKLDDYKDLVVTDDEQSIKAIPAGYKAIVTLKFKKATKPVSRTVTISE